MSRLYICFHSGRKYPVVLHLWVWCSQLWFLFGLIGALQQFLLRFLRETQFHEMNYYQVNQIIEYEEKYYLARFQLNNLIFINYKNDSRKKLFLHLQYEIRLRKVTLFTPLFCNTLIYMGACIFIEFWKVLCLNSCFI